MKTIVTTSLLKSIAVLATVAVLGAGSAMAETVRYAVAAEPYPPFSSPDSAGNWTGWEIDFAKALCEKAKFDCVITPIAWDGIIPALTSKKTDMIIASMSITAEREKTIDFSDKYYNTPTVVVAAKDASFKPTKEGLAGKIIGVQTSTIHENYVRKHFTDAAEIKQYQTQDEVNQDLVAGRIDATEADSMTLDAFLQSPDGKACCKQIGEVEDDPEVLGAGVGVGLRKGETALKDKINAAIKAVRADGTYDAITKKYFAYDIYGK